MTNRNALFPAEAIYIYSKENTEAVTYPKNNSNRSGFAVIVTGSDLWGPTTLTHFVPLGAQSLNDISPVLEVEDEKTDVYFQMGSLEREYGLQAYKGKDMTAFRGDTISVSEQELSLLTAKKKLVNILDAEEKAAEYLLTREALYNLAIKNNCSADDSQAYKLIQKMKDAYASDDVIGKEYVTAYIQGTGLSTDEYWDNQFENYKKDFTIGAHMDTLKEEYMASHSIATFTPEEEAGWQKYLSQVANNYIAQDHLTDCR